MNEINNIDEYIENYPSHIKKKLIELRKFIKTLVPDATEKLSYGMPTFFLHKNLVHFAANKNHLGFYPAPSAIEKFNSQLSKYKTTKGAVQFKYEEDLPYDLIKEIVLFRVTENTEKYKNK